MQNRGLIKNGALSTPSELTLRVALGAEDKLLALLSHGVPGVASRLCFGETVSIEKQHAGTECLLTLRKRSAFSYEEIEKIVVICSKGFDIDENFFAELFHKAQAELRTAPDKVWCFVEGKLTCYLTVANNIVKLFLIKPGFQHQGSEHYDALMGSFEERILGCDQQESYVEVLGPKGILITIRSCLEVLKAHVVLTDKDFEAVYNDLTDIAFRDCALSEYETLVRFARERDPAATGDQQSWETFQGILYRMAKGIKYLTPEDGQIIRSAVRREGDYRDLPEVITRCLGKVKNNFPTIPMGNSRERPSAY